MRPHPEQVAPGQAHGGVVVANHGRDVLVEDGQGRRHRCVTRRRAERPVAGDRVMWVETGARAGLVVSVLERRSLLGRPDPKGRLQPLAANLDLLVVVLAPEPPFEEYLVDRYLVTAEYFRLRAILLLHKHDLLDTATEARLDARLAPYTHMGYPLLRSSVQQPEGLAALHRRLAGQSSVLVGQSGVGKSSLVRRLVPASEVAVGELSERTRLGRHTTVATTLYHLPGGGHLIDSPGVRDLDLWPIPGDRLAACFPEFRPHLGRCRFRDCRHDQEPGCALRAAVAAGTIQARRLASYHHLADPGPAGQHPNARGPSRPRLPPGA